jgi:hypothetical protein
MTDESISQVVLRLIDVLGESGVTYAFGGALALAAWSEPRATADVDVIIWVDAAELDRVVGLMHRAGVQIDLEAARAQVTARGMFAGMVSNVRVDVLFHDGPLRAASVSVMARARCTILSGAEPSALLSTMT